MRVALVIDSLAAGGAERSLADLTPELIQRGVSIDFLVLHDRGGLTGEVIAAGAGVHALAGHGRRSWVRLALEYLRSSQPDLVHTTLFDADVVGRVAGRLAGVPVVSSLVNTPYGAEHRSEFTGAAIKLRGAQLADMVTARGVRRFRAVSQAVKDAYVSRLHIRADRVDVIPEGRSPARLGNRTEARRAAARASLGLADEPMVLAVGRQDPQKGFDVLLESVPAMAEAVPGIQVLIAGRAGRASASLAAASDGPVRFLGERPDVPDLLCAADVFVLPSRREGIPGVVQEAMALEAPIVASDIGPVREAVGDPPAAWLVPVGDATALAQAVAEVLGDPSLAAARASKARGRFLAEFDISAVADQMVGFYERARG